MRCLKRCLSWSLPAVLLAAGFMLPNGASAGITSTGDISPTISSWGTFTTGYIGRYSDGSVLVAAGDPDDLVSLTCYIGYKSGASGTATVDGAGATWTNSDVLYLGGGRTTGGTGFLNILNGGALDNATAYVGYTLGTATVDGAGSTWGNSSDLYVGGNGLFLSHGGTGTLNVTGGGVLSSVNGYIGASQDSLGAVLVDGSGSMWTNTSTLSISSEKYSDGSLTISGGGSMVNYANSLVGCNSVASGTVTVDGVGSTWTNNANLYLGNNTGLSSNSGKGTVNITNGGHITVAGQTYAGLAEHVGGCEWGSINFGDSGGTLTTNGLWAGPTTWVGPGTFDRACVMTGTGTIHTNGIVTDVDLLFDASHGASHSFVINQQGQNITVNLDMHDSNNVADLGVGYNYGAYESYGSSLTIKDDVVVHSHGGYLAYQWWTEGTATVDGAGSKWNVGFELFVGRGGTATLNISNGAEVNVTGQTYVGYDRINAAGTISLDSGTLNTGGLWAGDAQLAGTGTINTRGLVTDMNLSFDSAHGMSQSFTLNSGQITVNLDMTDTAANGDLGVGVTGQGTLLIADAKKIYSATGYLGLKIEDAGGTATVTGAGSEWHNSGDLYVGNVGRGFLNVLNGGVVTNANAYLGYDESFGHVSVGVATVAGDSTWTSSGDLYVGYGWAGTMFIQSGGTVNDVNGYIGYYDGWNGCKVMIDGAQSRWNNSGDLYIGKGGQGTLGISNGAVVNVDGTTFFAPDGEFAGTVSFGTGGGTLSTRTLDLEPGQYQFSGAGTVVAHGLLSDMSLTFDNSSEISTTLAGSVVMDLNMGDSAVAGDLAIGYVSGSSRQLRIQNGAVVHSAAGSLGYGASSTGEATVTGNDSLWSCSGNLTLGDGSSAVGTLHVVDGATVAAASFQKGYGTAATVYCDGGTLRANADSMLFISVTNAYVGDDGMTIDSNGHDITVSQVLQADTGSTGGLTKSGDGTLILSGANTYTGRTIVEDGTLNLAANAQAVVLTGGGADIQHGKMVFDYIVSFGYPPLPPAAPDVLTPLRASFTGGTAPWTTGQFHSTTADGSHGLGWVDDDVSQKLTVMFTLYGDSNLDGSVNGTDLNAVLSYYNQSGEVWNHGDFNYDGSVNGTDLNTVLSNYNQSLSSSTAAVPEPSTLLLMVLGLLGLLAWKRKMMIKDL